MGGISLGVFSFFFLVHILQIALCGGRVFDKRERESRMEGEGAREKPWL